MFKVDVLTKKEEMAYENFLDGCRFSLIQHSIDWRNVICNLEVDDPFFIIAKENDEIVGVLPLYYYKCKFGNLLTTIAWHTISGIICSRNAVYCKEVYRALLDHSITIAKEMDCTVVSIGTNPFLDDKEYYTEYFKPDYILENFIQYINLNEIFEKGNVIHPNYIKRSDLTRNLKKAKTQPIIVSDEQTQDNVDEWFRIHEKRMKELGATPIPKKLFDGALINLIPKGEGKFLFAFHQGKMISGCLFIFNKKIMDVYMMSADSEYRRFGANYLITYSMLKWANSNGISTLNWQSSDRRGSGVYKWKEGWGSKERTFLYLTRVLGDLSQWKKMDHNELKETYKFHYLLPFNLLKKEHLKFTTKDELTLNSLELK